jgi:hypothetical protein
MFRKDEVVRSAWHPHLHAQYHGQTNDNLKQPMHTLLFYMHNMAKRVLSCGEVQKGGKVWRETRACSIGSTCPTRPFDAIDDRVGRQEAQTGER